VCVRAECDHTVFPQASSHSTVLCWRCQPKRLGLFWDLAGCDVVIVEIATGKGESGESLQMQIDKDATFKADIHIRVKPPFCSQYCKSAWGLNSVIAYKNYYPAQRLDCSSSLLIPNL
jgi:hypothetical protein